MTDPIDPIVPGKTQAAWEESRHTGNWQKLAVAARFKPAVLAARCRLSLRTIQRYFKKEYSVTLGEWLRAYRLSLAYGRLRNGETIKCVAIDLGYKQLSHFSRDFKKHYGCAPKFLNSARYSLPAGPPRPSLPHSPSAG